MDQKMNLNPMSCLWMKLFTNPLLCVMFNKFMKVVELVVVQIMGIVEDEKAFNNLDENKFYNKLCKNLDLCCPHV